MNHSVAVILCKNSDAASIVASAARMSTQSGTALEIYRKSGDREKDLKLIGKVLASGHKSVIEHQTLSVAFNDVSVMVEQFVIEFRLASYTVKSRRYVDFSSAGYVVPEKMNDAQKAEYCRQMNSLFADYVALMEMGVPKEDARFLLPYCLRSNFFMTLDARELIHMICSMISGRGARFDELRSLGEQLKEQFDEMYPGVIDAEAKNYRSFREESAAIALKKGMDATGDACLVDYPANAEASLEAAMAFSGRFESAEGKFLTPENMRLLTADVRPRELEMLNYTFRISDISLACLTHFTRHRIQSPLIPGVVRALAKGCYVLPDSVAALPKAEEIYRRAFERQTAAAQRMLDLGIGEEYLVYYAMSGHVMDIWMSVNARELLHFAKLRTCSRAQWEIQRVARKMLLCLNQTSSVIFSGYGPSCAVTGRCPEGKMSCGKPVCIENGKWIVKNSEEAKA